MLKVFLSNSGATTNVSTVIGKANRHDIKCADELVVKSTAVKELSESEALILMPYEPRQYDPYTSQRSFPINADQYALLKRWQDEVGSLDGAYYFLGFSSGSSDEIVVSPIISYGNLDAHKKSYVYLSPAPNIADGFATIKKQDFPIREEEATKIKVQAKMKQELSEVSAKTIYDELQTEKSNPYLYTTSSTTSVPKVGSPLVSVKPMLATYLLI